MKFTYLPALGQPLDGGIFCGMTTTPDGQHFAVVLLADKPAADLDWKGAVAWATSVGGALPTRPLAAMLFANAKEHFEKDWHWLSEEFDGSYAWGQFFGLGTQDSDRKSYEGRARAVRLIPISA